MAITATWHHLSTTTSLQRSSHTIDVVGNDAYIFGGELLPRQAKDNDIFRVNLKVEEKGHTNISQIKTSSAPPPRIGSASTVLDGKIYLFSGRGGEAMTPIEELGGLWVFASKDLSWSLLTPADPSDPFPEPRSYHAVTSDGSHLIFIHAGCPASGRLSDLWSFNIATRKWNKLADAPAPPRGGTSIAYINKKLYRMNGFDGKTEQGGMVDVYHPDSNTWDFQAFSANGDSGPLPRSVGALLPINVNGHSMLVTLFGEGDPSALGHAGAGKMFEDVWAYDIENEQWTKVDAKWDYDRRPPARGWFDAAVVNSSTIFLAGGLSEKNERLQDSWLLKF